MTTRLKPAAHADLLLAFACSVGAILMVRWAPDLTFLRILLGVPLVLVVPGYVLTVALFAESRQDGPSMVVWTISLSIAITILAALILNVLNVPLDTEAFTLTLAGFAAFASICAIARRPSGIRRPALVGSAGLLSPWTVSGIAAATVFTILLIFLREPTANTAVPGYSQLSARKEAGSGVRIHLESAEHQTTRYRISVSTPLEALAQKTVVLRPGERWSEAVRRPAKLRASTVTVALYRVGKDRKKPYRRLQLRP